MKANYKVYVHVYPDGKKYIGCTCRSLKTRWNGGLGYGETTSVFKAIFKFGWNNVRHYLLMDNLTKEEAYLYEAAFIRGWKTYTKGKGYNTVIPKINGADELNIPTYKECNKILIKDIYEDEVSVRRDMRYTNPNRKTRKVRCIETNQIFKSAEEAAMMHSTGRADTIARAIRNGCASGTCWIHDSECGYIEVPAHWEYVN